MAQENGSGYFVHDLTKGIPAQPLCPQVPPVATKPAWADDADDVADDPRGGPVDHLLPHHSAR